MKRLRVGIDGYNLALPRATGVATYGYSLAHTLADAGHIVEGVFGLAVGRDERRREARLIAALRHEPPKPLPRRERARLSLRAAMPRLQPRVREVALQELPHLEDLRRRIPSFARLTSCADLFGIAHRHFKLHDRFIELDMDDPPEIMHWTYPVPVAVKGARNIYTLHDLIPLKLPETTKYVTRHYARLVQRCVDSAAHICTVSEASRRDILDLLHADADRVTNTYQTSLLDWEKGREPALPLAFDGLAGDLMPNSYFLFFGAIEPKKNVGRLLEAYLGMRTETPLLIIGPRAWQSDEELEPLRAAEAAGNPQARRVHRLDFVPRDMLLRAIASARAVLFPSLHEGFGLPVLEALQLGAPVLTARTSSLPEVAGEAALFVDPYDVSSIAEGLRRLDTEPDLRARLQTLGPERAQLFSPARYLARLEEMYARTLREKPAA